MEILGRKKNSSSLLDGLALNYCTIARICDDVDKKMKRMRRGVDFSFLNFFFRKHPSMQSALEHLYLLICTSKMPKYLHFDCYLNAVYINQFLRIFTCSFRGWKIFVIIPCKIFFFASSKIRQNAAYWKIAFFLQQ